MEGSGLLDTWAGDASAAVGSPDHLPPWLPEDFDRYVEQFTASGFFGPISWYRNLDTNWEMTRDLPAPSMPCAFIGGSRDMVIAHRMEYVDSMKVVVARLPRNIHHRRSGPLDPAGGARRVQRRTA